MAKDLSHKLFDGISPEAFINGMENNKEQFMNWYEPFQWEHEEDQEFFQSLSFRDDLRCLILMAEWCGDVVRNVPVVFRAMEAASIPTHVLIMEEHTDVMDQFLTMGGRAIPIVIFTDTGGYVLGHWGPRPKHVQAIMTQFKAENPDREAADYQTKIAAARQDMIQAYGEGTAYQSVILKELRELLSGF